MPKQDEPPNPENKPVRFAIDVARVVRDAIHDVVNCCPEVSSATALISTLFLSLRHQCRQQGSFTIQQVYVLSDAECRVIDDLRRSPKAA